MLEDILVTKLHPPPLPAHYIDRAGALEALERGRDGVVMLVSAPAGYGKSTCISAWLASRDEPAAWISLEPSEGDPFSFANYVVAAVRTCFKEACPKTKALLSSGEQPSIAVLSRSLANELDSIGRPLTLVLDDYHNVDRPTVNDLLSELVLHPPAGLHLIVITRRDPALPLASLRGRWELTDVRMADLEFNRTESELILRKSTDLGLSKHAIDHVHALLEGWPSGLHLVSLALQTQSDPEAFLRNLSGPTYEVEKFLAHEVLNSLPTELQTWLLETSILNRFCGPLCEAVRRQGRAGLEGGLDGESFIEAINASGLFAIVLDAGRRWWRFHHTFQALLRSRLDGERTAREINDLQMGAVCWFEENGFADEAFQYAIAAGNMRRASGVIRLNRNELMAQEKWAQLDRWLSALPPSVAEADPALLATQAWSCEFRFRSSAEDYLRMAEEALDASPADLSELDEIQADIDGLNVLHLYFVGENEEALTRAGRSLVGLRADALSQRAYVLAVSGLARQSLGDFEGCLRHLHAALEEHGADPAFRAILLVGMSYAFWMEGDLVAMKRTARQLLKLGEEQALPTSVTYAYYLLGIAHLARDERVEAGRCLEAVVGRPYATSKGEYYQASFALARLRLAEGRNEDAQGIVESIASRALGAGDARLIALTTAFEADVDLHLGLRVRALRLAERLSPKPFRNIYQFFVPHLALARAWVADGSREARESAVGLLDELLAWPPAAHNVPIRIELLALHAVADAASGNDTAAMQRLIAALELATPGRFLRPFADLGEPMAQLLDRLPEAVARTGIVRRIRAAFESGPEVDESQPATREAAAVAESLTNREKDVLELLVKRLRDKEIAEILFVSPETVKFHLKGIYRKLGVRGRRDAVARARELRILADS